jgi:hypothetical protein
MMLKFYMTISDTAYNVIMMLNRLIALAGYILHTIDMIFLTYARKLPSYL